MNHQAEADERRPACSHFRRRQKKKERKQKQTLTRIPRHHSVELFHLQEKIKRLKASFTDALNNVTVASVNQLKRRKKNNNVEKGVLSSFSVEDNPSFPIGFIC